MFLLCQKISFYHDFDAFERFMIFNWPLRIFWIFLMHEVGSHVIGLKFSPVRLQIFVEILVIFFFPSQILYGFVVIHALFLPAPISFCWYVVGCSMQKCILQSRALYVYSTDICLWRESSLQRYRYCKPGNVILEGGSLFLRIPSFSVSSPYLCSTASTIERRLDKVLY